MPGPCDGDAGAPLFIEMDGIPTLVAQATSSSQLDGAPACGVTGNRYMDLVPFQGWIHRRISGCGNYPLNKRFEFGKSNRSCKPSDP